MTWISFGVQKRYTIYIEKEGVKEVLKQKDKKHQGNIWSLATASVLVT